MISLYSEFGEKLEGTSIAKGEIYIGEFYDAFRKLTFLKKLFYSANNITFMVDGPF